MDSWFRELHVPRDWRVYLATGFAFREKKNCAYFGSIGARICRQPPTLQHYSEGKVKTIFPQSYVYVLMTTTTRHVVSFIDFISIF